MDFKKLFLKTVLVPSLLGICIVGVILWKLFFRSELPNQEGDALAQSQDESGPEVSMKQDIGTQEIKKDPVSDALIQDDVDIQAQLDRDREEQKQTKYLKTKLEQTNLELEQEKALAEINKLKMENGTLKETDIDGPKGFPEVKIEYIGGDNVKKEAILSIAGVSFQVKEKSRPMDSIQVVSISDSSVTLHFSTPQNLTKTIDYKPE